MEKTYGGLLMASKRVYEDVASAIQESKRDMYQLAQHARRKDRAIGNTCPIGTENNIISEKSINQVMHTLEQNLIQHFKADNHRFSPKLFKEACHVKL